MLGVLALGRNSVETTRQDYGSPPFPPSAPTPSREKILKQTQTQTKTLSKRIITVDKEVRLVADLGNCPTDSHRIYIWG